MVVYSFSQLGLYQQCPKKYQFRYLDELEKSFETTPDLLLGTSVHAALERFYQQLNIYKKPEKADLITHFNHTRKENIEKNQNSLILKGEQSLEDYQRRGEHYLDEYYDCNAPFENIKIVGTELMLHFSLDEAGERSPQAPKFRWIVDRLDKEWENFIINDYKTNKNLPPEQKDEYREQLTLYAQGIYQKYGKYFQNIKARLHYLHFWLIDEWEIDQEKLNQVVEKYRNLISQIENARFEHNMGIETAFPTKENAYCKYCEYQMICPLWKHLNYGAEEVEVWELGKETIAKLVDEYAELSWTIAEASKKREFLKEFLIKYAQENAYLQLFWEQSKISLSKGQTFTAKDKQQLWNLLSKLNLLEDYTDIPYYKLASLVKEKKLTPDQISNLLTQKDSRTLRASKKRTDPGDWFLQRKE